MAPSKKPASSPPYARIGPSTFLVQAPQLGTFARTWASGREADIRNMADLNPNDPHGFGSIGPVPTTKGKISIGKLFRFYKEEGSFARVIDQIPEDSWAEGWTLSTKNEAWTKEAQAVDKRLKLRARAELADKWHFTGGLSLLYLSLDASDTDPKLAPGTVKDVYHVQVVPRTRIIKAVIGENPDAPDGRFDQPTEWHFKTKGGKEIHAHWSRVIPFRQFPDPHSDWDGISVGGRIYDGVVYKANVRWAAGTSYVQRAAPLLVVEIKDGVKPTPAEVDQIDEEMDLLQNHTIQKVIARNFKVVPLTGSATLPDPMRFWLIALREISIITRIPVHVLAGMAAGELSSSTEDTRRYNGYISRRQENWAAEEILFDWYQRLASWNIIKPVPDDLVIKWKSLGEPTIKEVMEIEKTRADTIGAYRNSQVQPPKTVVDYEAVEPKLSKLPPQTEYFGNPADIQGGPGQRPKPPPFKAEEATIDETVLSPDEKIMVTRVKRVERKVEVLVCTAFDAYFDQWRPILEKHLRLVAAQENVKDGKPSATLRLELDRALREAVLEAYRLGMDIGAQDTFRELGKDPIHDLLRDSHIKEFRTVSKLHGHDVAIRVTDRIRGEIAEGLSHGEGYSQLRDRVERTYRDIAKYEAERIARTEAMTAYNRGSQLAMQEAGVKRFRLIVYPGADNNDPDGPCNRRKGMVFDVGDEDNMPPFHPHDRCTMQAIAAEDA